MRDVKALLIVLSVIAFTSFTVQGILAEEATAEEINVPQELALDAQTPPPSSDLQETYQAVEEWIAWE